MKKILLPIFIFIISLSFCNAQQMIYDIRPGSGNSIPSDFKVLNDSLALFIADDSLHGKELWVTDGTTAGTLLLKDIYDGTGDADPKLIDTVGGKMIFFATKEGSGRELWATDGKLGGTDMLADIDPGMGSAFTEDIFLGHAGNKIFVVAENSPNGDALYVTDGTLGGTGLVKDICVGAGNDVPGWSYIKMGVAVGDLLYFTSYGTTCSGFELWVTDGTSLGTTMIKSFDAFPRGYCMVGSHFVFIGHTPTEGFELWKSDGTLAGTTLANFGDINPGTSSSNIGNMVKGGPQTALFTANNGVIGNEWYEYYDGSGMTFDLPELVPGSNEPFIILTHAFDPNLGCIGGYFVAQDYIHGFELYGFITTMGLVPHIVRDINPWGSSDPMYFSSNDCLTTFFTAEDGEHGRELWVTDGSTSGTRRLTDIRSGWESSVYSTAVKVNDKLVFGADDGIHGIELFSVDYATILSLENTEAINNELRIYPNPVKDQFVLELPTNIEAGKYVSIWNNLGQEVMQIPLAPDAGNSYSIDVSVLSPGVYIGTINTGKTIYKFKLIKA
jgi:trimeric autotransporter adhesin